MTQIKSKHQGVKYLLFFYSIYSCDHCDHKATQNESSTETLQIKTDGVFRDDHVSVQMWSPKCEIFQFFFEDFPYTDAVASKKR